MDNIKTIRRQKVLDYININTSPRTLKQMAREISMKEASVRAGIIWLIHAGYVSKGPSQLVHLPFYKKKVDSYLGNLNRPVIVNGVK